MAPDELTRIGPYEIVAAAGRTNEATLYTARDAAHGRTVRLEVAVAAVRDHPEAAARFQRQREQTATLGHSNVLRVFEVRRDDGQLYAVVEHADGVSLDALLRRRQLTLKEAVRLIEEVGQALEFAHRRGVVHGHLDPRSIIVSHDLTRAKVGDFGGPALAIPAADAGTLATGHLSLTSVHYLAPEVAGGGDPADPRSDVYSLGAVFYEMLTGRPPSGKVSLPSHLVADLPSGLDPIVLRCLARDPGQRYQAVAPFLADLGRLEESLKLRLADELKGFSRTGRNVFDGSGDAAPRRRPTLLIALLVTAGVLLLAAVAFFVLAPH
jgi:eukaryotic-like serine/threonine-protein kinase